MIHTNLSNIHVVVWLLKPVDARKDDVCPELRKLHRVSLSRVVKLSFLCCLGCLSRLDKASLCVKRAFVWA